MRFDGFEGMIDILGGDWQNAVYRVNLGTAGGATPATASRARGGGTWTQYNNIDMCGQGDVEIIGDWKRHHTIASLKKIVEEKRYSAFTVSNGQPSFGHAALKKFNFVVTKEHCKPITACCRHPCTIYIYTPRTSAAGEDEEERCVEIDMGVSSSTSSANLASSLMATPLTRRMASSTRWAPTLAARLTQTRPSAAR